MKARKSRDLIIFLILIPIFLWAAFFVSSRMENKLPAYSVINKSSMGSSVFYETLRQLKLPAERSLKPVIEHDINTIQIAASGGSFNLNSEELKTWLNQGGTLIHLAPESFRVVEFDLKPEIRGKFIIYKYGNGIVVGYDAFQITNKQLMSNTAGAYELLEEIGKQGNKKIYFNESHLYDKPSNKTLWDYVPLWLRFLVFQIILSLAAFFYCKGKRFGKPIALYDEVERTENEYLYSASSLYRQTKAYDLIADIYYSNLLRQLKSNEEEWIEEWERQGLAELNKAKQVYEFMKDTKLKKKNKDYTRIISVIEQLNKVLKKRRDLYWKTLRK
ncbi:DUF4350 domain-containing protein [Clostridium swellfunianum]|uniref:DUF4350 domain-containing protein n=1 Tax=Clostridium swellfunianum TaxID=1367462 RepID=UPI00202E6111|nr:DUF4350 domain-containing protein [Clostridium swellfunianum]MCM0647932.1 DUF4350 domain-containing protein [Clostridium swellfunianum]